MTKDMLDNFNDIIAETLCKLDIMPMDVQLIGLTRHEFHLTHT